MAYTYPYKTNEDFKTAVSFVDISFDDGNIESSMRLAMQQLKDVVGSSVWNLAINHLNSENYQQTGYTVLDNLVLNIANVHAPLSLYHHFIWLQLRISSNAITVTKSENETAAFKYQTDEAKEKLLEVAWAEYNVLIDFLNLDATSDEGNPVAEWRETTQYTELQKLIVFSYVNFCELAAIDRNALFFMRCMEIMKEHQAEEIEGRVFTKDETFKESFVQLSAAKQNNLKKALVLLTLADAVEEFDFLLLPEKFKAILRENEQKNSHAINLQERRDRLAGKIRNKANSYLQKFDMSVISESAETTDTTPYDDYVSDYDDDNFIATL